MIEKKIFERVIHLSSRELGSVWIMLNKELIQYDIIL